ncbi:MAG: biotin/lipoyl-binding protein [Burkholderiales bacterium]|nr:biotin/lipoyl-binding protein [Burkholderiales bacterium]
MIARVTQEDLVDILQAFEASGFTRLELTLGPLRVAAKRVGAADGGGVESLASAAQVVAPLLGIFQAGSHSNAPALVRPGTRVQADTIIGFISVMRKLTAVKAGRRGTVAQVLVEDGQFVEYGQTLLQVSTQSAAAESERPESHCVNAR